MNNQLNQYVKSQLHLFNKINDLYAIKAKDCNIFNTYNRCIKKISHEDFHLGEIFNYSLSDMTIFSFIKIQLFNIANNREIKSFDIYHNGKRITNDIIIIIALLCEKMLVEKFMPMINANVFNDDYIYCIYTSLRYKIKFRKFLNSIYGPKEDDYNCEFIDVLTEFQEYLFDQRFCVEHGSCVKINYKSDSKIKNQYLSNLKDGTIAAELHWNTVTRCSIEKTIQMIKEAHQTFFKLHKTYPVFYLIKAWYLDEKIVDKMPNSFIKDFSKILFEVPELDIKSDSILYHVYGGNRILHSDKRQTKLIKYIEENYNKVTFFKKAFIVKTDNDKCIFKDVKYNWK